MDRVDHYCEAVRSALLTIAADVPPQEGIRTEVVADDRSGHYELLSVGWVGPRRIHGTLVHCDVVDGKVRVEHDGTDAGLVEMLVAAGVPCHDIILAFHQPELREYTPYASSSS